MNTSRERDSLETSIYLRNEFSIWKKTVLHYRSHRERKHNSKTTSQHVKTLSELEWHHKPFRQAIYVPQSRKPVTQTASAFWRFISEGRSTPACTSWVYLVHLQLILTLQLSLSLSFSLITHFLFSHSWRCEELVHDCRKTNHNLPPQEKSFFLLLMTEHSPTCTSHFITLSNTLAQWYMDLFKFIWLAFGTYGFKTCEVLGLKLTYIQNIFMVFLTI